RELAHLPQPVRAGGAVQVVRDLAGGLAQAGVAGRGPQRVQRAQELLRLLGERAQVLVAQALQPLRTAAHGGLRWTAPGAASRGTSKMKVAPLPASLSTQMRPRCCSTMALEMASPRPVPPLRRASEESICWNLRKSSCRLWSGMPGPLSCT